MFRIIYHFSGKIVQYSLLRDSIEIYRTESEMQYLDDNAIQPYETYTYVLQVCTVEGCTSSDPVSTCTCN